MSKEKKYYYTNPETGEREEISKETHEMMQYFRCREGGKGRLIVISTAGTPKDEGELLWKMDK